LSLSVFVDISNVIKSFITRLLHWAIKTGKNFKTDSLDELVPILLESPLIATNISFSSELKSHGTSGGQSHIFIDGFLKELKSFMSLKSLEFSFWDARDITLKSIFWLE
jgi:hypothetical protein